MKNGSESATNGGSGTVVELTGMDFLTLELDCTQCDWRGEVGDMYVRTVTEPKATKFICPKCDTQLARHTGPIPDEVWTLE